ncbi:MAG: hypothetical protein HFE63_06025 [Clostridiales bacterium]|nr:hypothetical protein [Clostridiales bacterium]
MLKKFTAGSIILALLLASCACGNNSDIKDTDNSDSVQTSGGGLSETDEGSAVVTDDLGDMDFGGAEFNMLTRTTPLFYPYHDVESETGDVLNDAVYKRTRKLEERFNFDLIENYYDYTIEGSDYPRRFMMANDDTYDVYVGRCVHMFNYAAEGMLYTLDDIPNINTDKPYWNAQLLGDLEVSGSQFFAVGDFNISALDFTHVMLFNKQMLEDYKLENPYELVLDGKWTFDKFGELARSAVSDINGDSQMDEQDQYGYTSIGKQVLPGFWIAANTKSINKNSDGELVFSAASNERFIDVCQKIFTITWDDNIWHRVPKSINREEEIELFSQGHALFTNSSCFQISTIRDTSVNFGILPYPKYDENQTEYYSRIEGAELFGVPKTNTNLEMTGAILEAMACESRISVVPAYYEVALKVKFTQDEESADMLDIAFKNRVFDFGDTVFCDELREGVLFTAFTNNDRNLVSLLTGVESSVNAAIQKVNEGFKENG